MTTRVALPFPVLPGRDPRKIANRFIKEPEVYREARRDSGVTLERAYLQQTPMGDFVVAYIESDRDFMEMMGTIANPTNEMARWFVDTVKEVHGIDMTQPPAQLPELVAEWVDPDVSERRRGFAFCAPVVPEQLQFGKDWARRTFASDDMTRTRRDLGENLEVVFLTHTEQGPITAIYLEGNDPDRANREFSASDDPFNVEFREALQRIYPPFVDMTKPIEGVTEIFDSRAVGGEQELTGQPRQASRAATSG
jgi:hypothetical protein